MPRLQINLLPDIKQAVVKQQRTRNLITTASALVSAFSVVILLIMLSTVYVVQKKQLSNSDKSIAESTAQLQKIPNVDKVLTVQNQLKSLADLHHAKHASSRIFTYLTQITPSQVNVGHVSLDLAAGTMQFDGTASSQHTINVFIDTLKFTTYRLGSDSQSLPAFSNIIETSFGIVPGGATYSVSLKFDPALFSNAKLDANSQVVVPTLKVPQQITTRNDLNDINSLFNGENTRGTR